MDCGIMNKGDDLMTLNQLIYFCRLAETEHYGQAAKALYISQPSLSKSIGLLEEELKVSLFERRGRIDQSRTGLLSEHQTRAESNRCRT